MKKRKSVKEIRRESINRAFDKAFEIMEARKIKEAEEKKKKS